MIQLVIQGKLGKVNDGVVYTFEEEFNRYRRHCKKKCWATPEGFSLMYDSTLADLKKSVFVYTDNEDTYKHLKQFYKVIEQNKVSSDVNEYLYISVR